MTMMKKRDRHRDREIGHAILMSRHLSCHGFETHRRKKKYDFRGKVRKSRNYFYGMPRASLENFDFPCRGNDRKW